nr:sulfotransferase family protein [Nonomuraea sediminis]
MNRTRRDVLDVIGAGFPRTGTTSMKAALERLGFGPCNHMFDLLSNPAQLDRWLTEPLDPGKALEGYRSAQDWPASHFWRELALAIPEAKVVLTVRDPRRWYASMQMLLTSGPLHMREQDLPEEAAALATAMRKLVPLLDGIGQSYFGEGWHFTDGMPDEGVAVAAFQRHVATVQESLPAHRLLVFDVRDGWEPLCRFLGVSVPVGEPFPHLNDSEALRRTFERLMAGGSLSAPPGSET